MNISNSFRNEIVSSLKLIFLLQRVLATKRLSSLKLFLSKKTHFVTETYFFTCQTILTKKLFRRYNIFFHTPNGFHDEFIFVAIVFFNNDFYLNAIKCNSNIYSMTKVFVAKNAFCDKTYFVAIYFFRNEKKIIAK